MRYVCDAWLRCQKSQIVNLFWEKVSGLFFATTNRSAGWKNKSPFPNRFPGGNSKWEPPDPFPNSEVKTLSADGSVGSPHVRVGHRQDLIQRSRIRLGTAFLFGVVLTQKGVRFIFRDDQPVAG